MISIIIPAHNEEAVIGRCLSHLTRGIHPGGMEIIVVCNGCTDGTAEVARTFSKYVTIIEIDVASKVAALNTGDSKALGFPRFYVDADIVIEADCIYEVAEVLEGGKALVAAPKLVVEYIERNWLIRSYYKIWLLLPYISTNMVGAGVYALSKEGRMRFGKFPAVIADDEFIRLLFELHEYQSEISCSFKVFAPTRLSGLVKIMTRSRLGRLQLKGLYPDLIKRPYEHPKAIWRLLLLQPELTFSAIIYLTVTIVTRLLARRRYKRHEFTVWDRDDSARQAEQRRSGVAVQ